MRRSEWEACGSGLLVTARAHDSREAGEEGSRGAREGLCAHGGRLERECEQK